MKTKEIQFDGKKYEVFYFTEPENLLLPDKELIEVLKESNPDWFE